MKKDTNALVEQKSVLAKLMASENITVEHKKIPTAAFDIKNRVLANFCFFHGRLSQIQLRNLGLGCDGVNVRISEKQ